MTQIDPDRFIRSYFYPLGIKVVSWAGSAAVVVGGAVVTFAQSVSPAPSVPASSVGVASILTGIALAFLPLYFKDRSERRADLRARDKTATELATTKKLLERAMKHIHRLTNESKDTQSKVMVNVGRLAGHDGKLDSHMQVLVDAGFVAAPRVTEPPGTTYGRILLVEDHPDTARALSRILTDRGFDVEHAASVAEAIAGLDSSPMWVLLDLMLPDGSGIDVLNCIRERSLNCHVAIVTAAADDTERMAAAREWGPDVVFSKPVDFEDLMGVLRGDGRGTRGGK